MWNWWLKLFLWCQGLLVLQHLRSCHPAKLIKTLSMLKLYRICSSQKLGRNASSVPAHTLCADKVNYHKPLFPGGRKKKENVYCLTESRSFACWYQGFAPGQLSQDEHKGQFPSIAKAQADKHASSSKYTGKESTFSHQTIFFPIYGLPFQDGLGLLPQQFCNCQKHSEKP